MTDSVGSDENFSVLGWIGSGPKNFGFGWVGFQQWTHVQLCAGHNTFSFIINPAIWCLLVRASMPSVQCSPLLIQHIRVVSLDQIFAHPRLCTLAHHISAFHNCTVAMLFYNI